MEKRKLNPNNVCFNSTQPIPGFPDYTIDKTGKVLDKKGNERKIFTRGNSDHLSVSLKVPGTKKFKIVYINSILAEIWLGPKEEGKFIYHLDGDRTNVHPLNLAYLTKSECSNRSWELKYQKKEAESNSDLI